MPDHHGINIPPSLEFESTTAAIDSLGSGFVLAEMQEAINLLDLLSTTTVAPEGSDGVAVPIPPVTGALLELVMHVQTVFDHVVANYEAAFPGSITLADGDSQSSVTISLLASESPGPASAGEFMVGGDPALEVGGASSGLPPEATGQPLPSTVEPAGLSTAPPPDSE